MLDLICSEHHLSIFTDPVRPLLLFTFQLLFFIDTSTKIRFSESWISWKRSILYQGSLLWPLPVWRDLTLWRISPSQSQAMLLVEIASAVRFVQWLYNIQLFESARTFLIPKAQRERLEKQLRWLFTLTRLFNVSSILMSSIASPPVYQSSSLCKSLGWTVEPQNKFLVFHTLFTYCKLKNIAPHCKALFIVWLFSPSTEKIV